MVIHGSVPTPGSTGVLRPELPFALKALAGKALATGQHTLQQAVACGGVGLHLGRHTTVCIRPAPAHRGRYFVRTDLAGEPEIPAHIEAVQAAVLSTTLGQGGVTVQTVEHLLAALVGLGVDNARIEVDGPELPLLDGSALEWAVAIATAGLRAQSPPRRQPITLSAPLIVQEGDAFVMALPSPTTQFSYGIDFPVEAIGQQWFSLPLADVASEIVPARTFCLAEQVDTLRARGLIKGGSLENALVCGSDGWLNPPLRYANEPVRHKLLDLIGDLSLLGQLPQAHVLAYKASHALHLQFAQQLMCQDLDHPTPVMHGHAP